MLAPPDLAAQIRSGERPRPAPRREGPRSQVGCHQRAPDRSGSVSGPPALGADQHAAPRTAGQSAPDRPHTPAYIEGPREPAPARAPARSLSSRGSRSGSPTTRRASRCRRQPTTPASLASVGRSDPARAGIITCGNLGTDLDAIVPSMLQPALAVATVVQSGGEPSDATAWRARREAPPDRAGSCDRRTL